MLVSLGVYSLYINQSNLNIFLLILLFRNLTKLWFGIRSSCVETVQFYTIMAWTPSITSLMMVLDSSKCKPKKKKFQPKPGLDVIYIRSVIGITIIAKINVKRKKIHNCVITTSSQSVLVITWFWVQFGVEKHKQIFQRQRNCLSLYGKCNLWALKNLQVLITPNLQEKSCYYLLITYSQAKPDKILKACACCL